jgi:hypothetical protein
VREFFELLAEWHSKLNWSCGGYEFTGGRLSMFSCSFGGCVGVHVFLAQVGIAGCGGTRIYLGKGGLEVLELFLL